VTSAAHAQFFLGNFQLPNITDLHLNALQSPGMFINAPQNRLVTLCFPIHHLSDLPLTSFTTFATNVTYKNTELTPVPDKRCIGTVSKQLKLVIREI